MDEKKEGDRMKEITAYISIEGDIYTKKSLAILPELIDLRCEIKELARTISYDKDYKEHTKELFNKISDYEKLVELYLTYKKEEDGKNEI
jgi:hypothetical protein